MSNTKPTSFRLLPEVLDRLDLLAKYLCVVHGVQKVSRATALAYLVMNALDPDGMPTWRFYREDELPDT